jgi:hypothetical protein
VIGSAFRGDLLQWRTPRETALLRVRRPVAADVVIQVDVSADQSGQSQAADLRFYYGGQLLWATPVTHGNPVQTNTDLTAGQAVIPKGAIFTMMPPSSVGEGTLKAENLVLISNGSTVNLSGILASWPLPPAGPPPGSLGPEREH